MDPLIYRMALTMIPKIGAITAKKLIAYIGSPEGVFREKTGNLRKIPGIGEFLSGKVLEKNYPAMAEEEIERMRKRGISCTYYQDASYPWRLKNCEDGPLLLYYKGATDFNRAKILSIVGTRNSTDYGRDLTQQIISELGSSYPDLIIVSGLAYGIDIAAHRAALENGLHTIATLAHGLNTIYPSAHTNAAVKIMKQGALASDFHSTVLPERNNFLRRNRIIAGLSDATLVIESGRKGGALITAEIASSYNREVMAIPGRSIDPFSAGCNFLIKNNIAALVDSSEELEKLLNWQSENATCKPMMTLKVPLSNDEKTILKTISENPGLGQEILSARTGIPVHKLVGHLLQMELRNWLTVTPGNLYKAAVKL